MEVLYRIFMILRADSDDYIAVDGDDATAADRTFGIEIVDGADAANGATIDVWGYLIDS